MANMTRTQNFVVQAHIYVAFRLEGTHRWDDAPDEVAFLRNDHRHMFHFKASVGVKHDDRDIEFFMLQRELTKFMKDKTNYKSCEMMARELGTYIANKYPGRYVEVEVSEDGENGAICSFMPKE